MVPKSGTDEIPFYWMIRHPRKNPFCIPFLIINQAIETHLRRSSRLRTSSKGFLKRKNGGERWAFARSDGLLEAECTTAVASWPRSPRFCAQPNPRAEGEGENRAEEAEERATLREPKTSLYQNISVIALVLVTFSPGFSHRVLYGVLAHHMGPLHV